MATMMFRDELLCAYVSVCVCVCVGSLFLLFDNVIGLLSKQPLFFPPLYLSV